MDRALIYIALGCSLFSAGLARGQGNYRWPMKLQPELTSRFCDYRTGHFHAGLDIRTRAKPGYRVYAVDDGYIYRATTSYRGYGKAIYIMLKDGQIAVYGHLLKFEDKLNEDIRKRQMSAKSYGQNLFFKPDEYPVKKGNVIGYSGSSGATAPHLHFEIRSPDNRPLNPLKNGFPIADNRQPVFDKLALRHYSSGFAPGNPCDIEIIDIAKGSGGGEYVISDTVIGGGELALAVSGGDRIEGKGFLYGFYSLKLLVDDNIIFSMDSDSITYETTRQFGYVRDMELTGMVGHQKGKDNDENVFYRLYVPPNNRQYFWGDFGSGAGVIPEGDSAGQIRDVRIVAVDEGGNSANLRFVLKTPELAPPASEFVSYYRFGDTVMVDFMTFKKVNDAKMEYRNRAGDRYERVESSLSTRLWNRGNEIAFLNTLIAISPHRNREYRFGFSDGEGKISLWIYFIDGADRKGLYLNGSPDHLEIEYFPGSIHADLSILIVNQSKTRTMKMNQTGLRAYGVDLRGYDLSGLTNIVIRENQSDLVNSTIELFPAFPGETLDAFSPDSTLIVSFDMNSAFYPAYIFPSNGVAARIFGGGALSFDIKPANLIADSPVRFILNLERLGLTERKIGAYGYSPHNDKWGFIGRGVGSRIDVEGSGLGKIALIVDNEPPSISYIRPKGKIKSRKPLLSCKISDGISGVDLDGGISMKIDGIWVPADYDLSTRKFAYKVRNNLRRGRHKLEIEAYDRQGNKTSISKYFTILGN